MKGASRRVEGDHHRRGSFERLAGGCQLSLPPGKHARRPGHARRGTVEHAIAVDIRGSKVIAGFVRPIALGGRHRCDRQRPPAAAAEPARVPGSRVACGGDRLVEPPARPLEEDLGLEQDRVPVPRRIDAPCFGESERAPRRPFRLVGASPRGRRARTSAGRACLPRAPARSSAGKPPPPPAGRPDTCTPSPAGRARASPRSCRRRPRPPAPRHAPAARPLRSRPRHSRGSRARSQRGAPSPVAALLEQLDRLPLKALASSTSPASQPRKVARRKRTMPRRARSGELSSRRSISRSALMPVNASTSAR